MIVGVPAPHYMSYLHRPPARHARPVSRHRDIKPPPPAPASAPAVSSAPSGYTIPGYIVQCESGGNPQAVNPSSGAGGLYQITPATWAAYGGLAFAALPQLATVAEQGIVAARIWAATGPSAWTCAK